MNRKTVTLLLISFLPFFKLSAQISEIEQVIRSSSNLYVQYTSIVRNYDKEHNVLMQYSYYTTLVTTDTIKSRSTFMIQNTNTGDITKIVNLPLGYKVNDVRFVRLRKNDGVTTEDFCCFCGTRTQFDGIEYLPTLPGEPSQFIELYSKHGFAGFFSMDEALNPSTSYTVKVRDVENTKELYRMVCYAEEHGHYYSTQNIFFDNAVLDIIGEDDTVYAPSCFCRAKFYPGYLGSGVHWDNNMRINNYEVLTDIAKTDNYVVTTSHNISGNTQWIRYSGLEDHHVPGGLQLNGYVNALDFSSMLFIQNCDTSQVGYFYRNDAAKLCHVNNDNIAVAFHMYNLYYDGLVCYRVDYSNGAMTFNQGAYLKGLPYIEEMIHLPSNNATVISYNENNSFDYVSVLTWNQNGCVFPVRNYYNDNINPQSITLQERNGYEHMLWCGIETVNPTSPMYLMTQRGILGGGFNNTCHKIYNDNAQSIIVNYYNEYHSLPIVYRYPYDDVTFPVRYIHFNPQEFDKEILCIK